MSSVIAGLGEWNSVEGEPERGCKEMGMKKNKIGGMERNPNKLADYGWLGWPTTCRGVSFKGVGGRGQKCPCINKLFPPSPVPSPVLSTEVG
jgi:hypothetical protein